MSSESVPTFDDARLIQVTWSVGETFGGMTNVFFHRARAFHRLTGKTVELLTLAPDLDPEATTERMLADGQLLPGMRLRNLWTELRVLSDEDIERLGRLSPGVLTPARQLVEAAPDAASSGDNERFGPNSVLLQVDRRRQDGTLLSTDERDVKQPGVPGGRRISVYDRAGTMRGQWRSASAFYADWVQFLTEGQPAFVIIDSQFVANLLHAGRYSNTVKVAAVHSTHVEAGANPATGPLPRGKFGFMTHFDAYDAVAVLTQTQANEILRRGLADDRLVAIPNSRSLPDKPYTGDRLGSDFVVVARLVGTKRLDHVLRALAAARLQRPGATLTIYGGGDARASLEALTHQLGLADAVTFAGVTPQGAKRFFEHRFSLLSSRFEGLALTLIESQAAGCIPISYDISYGPGDIITDGTDGFLVGDGDIDGLSRAMIRAIDLSPAEFDAMSRNAFEAAHTFSDESVTQQWAQLAEAGFARKAHGSVASASILGTRIDGVSEGGLSVSARLYGTLTTATKVYISWDRSSEGIYGRVRCAVESGPGTGEWTVRAIVPSSAPEGLTGQAGLNLDVISDRTFQRDRFTLAHAWPGVTVGSLIFGAVKAGGRVTFQPASG